MAQPVSQLAVYANGLKAHCTCSNHYGFKDQVSSVFGIHMSRTETLCGVFIAYWTGLRAVVYQQTHIFWWNFFFFKFLEVTNEVERAWITQYSDWVWAECPWFSFQQRAVIFLFTTISIPAVQPTQPSCWVDTRVSAPRFKASRSWSWQFISSWCRDDEYCSFTYIYPYAFVAWC
jgi:hypothetical protein